MQVIEFNGWTFEVDRKATEAVYAAETASVDECGCSDCRRFDAARYDLLHPDARALLERLGVDVAKETELVNFGPDSNNRDIWSWLYNFVGRVVAVPEQAEREGDRPFTTLSSDFAIGFTSNVTLVSEAMRERGPVVQAECFYYEGKAERTERAPVSPAR